MQNKTAKGKPSKKASQPKPKKVQETQEVQALNPSIAPDEISTNEVKPSEVTPTKIAPENVAPVEVNGYVVPKGEEQFVHVKLTQNQRFNPETGEEISKPRIQKFGIREWYDIEKSLAKLGYKVEVLFMPKF